MEPDSLRNLFSYLLPILIGGALGAALGYIGECTSGTCPLTSTWWRGALYGSVMGLLFAITAAPSRGAEKPGAAGKAPARSGETPIRGEGSQGVSADS